MPPLERKTFRSIGKGDIPDKVGFVKVRTDNKPGKNELNEYIIFKANLKRASSLRQEAERNRQINRLYHDYVDAGFINVTSDGLIVVGGRPEEVLDVRVKTWVENLPFERESTIALVQRIAGRRRPVTGGI